MASKTTLNAKNIEALGVERLANLLIEISTGDAAIKRRLRMELAGNQSPGDLPRKSANAFQPPHAQLLDKYFIPLWQSLAAVIYSAPCQQCGFARLFGSNC